MTDMSQSDSDRWRDEMYGDESGADPFWVPVEGSDGYDRDPVEAAVLVKGFIGAESFEDGVTVRRIRGRIEHRAFDGSWFTCDPEGDLECWEVRCSLSWGNQ